MRLILGLGNPGTKFLNNRHNVGHMFVDWSKKGIKTDCFMNESGKFVKKIARTQNLEPSNLFVAHDDLDLPLGQWKIQFGVGPKVHYGVNSVEEALRTKNFWRVRIGVDNRDPQNRTPGEEYVLQDFFPEERETLNKVFDEIIKDYSFPK